MSETAVTILVVDDDPFTAELTGMILEMGGYETLLAEGGIDALDKLASTPGVSMVVSDMNMPFMDGAQLFAEIRETGCNLPFVLITGEEAAPLRQAYPDIDVIITKDENLQEQLPGIVESLLAKHRG